MNLYRLMLVGLGVLGATPASAVLLSYMPFNGGAIGQSLADSVHSGNGAVGFGFAPTFTAITNDTNGVYVAGLTGSMGGSGNAFLAGDGGSHRNRFVIDGATAAYQNSNLLVGQSNLITFGTLFGSFLVANPNGAPTGFSGLEFSRGDATTNRRLTIGEAAGSNDWVVLSAGQAAATADASNLALPTADSTTTREVVFRIDYNDPGVGVDTFTLINADGSDGDSGVGDFAFSSLHLASFGGSPGVVYDEIRLGTTLADVYTVVPEPSVALLGGLGLLGLLRRRR